MRFRGVDYFNIDELLSEEERMTRNSAREFFEKEVEPLVADAFHREKPLDTRELYRKMGEMGMFGTVIPQEYGGGGTNYTSYGLISLEGERVDSAIGGATSERGGRSKKYYSLTQSGVKALGKIQRVQQTMWKGIPYIAGKGTNE